MTALHPNRLPIRVIIYSRPDRETGLPTRMTFLRQEGTRFSVKTYRVHGDASLRRVTALRANYQVLTRWPYHADELTNLRLSALERSRGRDTATRLRRQLERMKEPAP